MKPGFDVGVVGLGAVGSAAAYYAAQSGYSVVGFDRFNPPHAHGSSHGGSRIIRKAYFEGEVYLPLIERAYGCWRTIEDASHRTLVHRIGSLTAGERGGTVIEGAIRTANEARIAHEILPPNEVSRRYPAFRLRENEAALFEPDAGYIVPEDAIEAHLSAARALGAELRMSEPVERWIAGPGSVQVETASGSTFVGALVICAGGWIRPLLADLDLPLVVERQVNVWFEPAAHADLHRPDRCPVYIWAFEGERVLYGFPLLPDGAKIGLHHAGQRVEQPEALDRTVHDDDVERVTEQVRKVLPHVPGAVRGAATCFYTNTPDERFIIDRHPEHHNVVYASACSGHGFKMSSAVGESLARLAVGSDPAVDLRPYRAERYRSAS